MMGNHSLSFKIIFVISFLLSLCHHSLVIGDLQTDIGSFDLHLKTGSSRQTKHIAPTDNQWGGSGGGDNEHRFSKGRGDQVQGLEQHEKSHHKKEDKDKNRVGQHLLQQQQPKSQIPLYIGCFSTWEKQFTPLIYNDLPVYKVDNGLDSCANKCRYIKGQIMLLRGFECQCAFDYQFKSMKIDDHLCHIPCPAPSRDYSSSSSEEPVHFPCGGDLGYSVYCLPDDTSNCTALIEEYKFEVITIKGHTNNHETLIMNDPCVTCDGGIQACRQPYLHPYFDYFPTNSPKKCVEFCGKDVPYVGLSSPDGGGISNERVRKATPYARLTWWWFDRVFLPICACIPAEDRRLYQPSSNMSACNVPCPGERDQMCGGQASVTEVYRTLYSTIYCVNPENGPCQEWDGLRPPSTTSTSSKPVDPCELEEIDCDDPYRPTSTEKEKDPDTESATDDTTEYGDVTTSLPTTTLSTSQPTFPPATPNRTSTTPTTTTTTSRPTTTSTTRATKPPTAPACSVRCNQVDRYGHSWRVCAEDKYGSKDCSDLIPNSVGQAIWRCLKNGEFETPNPDVSNCSSSWIEEKEKAVENITDFDEAKKFMERLSEMTRNSSSNYFGHEIRNVTGLIDKVLERSREFAQDFQKLEGMVKTAVNLNSFLIQHRKPWTDLNSNDKSTISTDIFESMEGVLFHLTGEAVKNVEDKDYLQIFKMENETDINRFLILAETFDKKKGGMNQTYEFPPKLRNSQQTQQQQQSFIKLPNGWKELIKGDKVEIAAMSIDPEYISYIMPGQYPNLMASTSIDQDDYDKNKLINGKLISLSLSQSENNGFGKSLVSPYPRVTFAGKGAEITFHHDIEAWGSEQQSVHRKLHDGEKPRAVLGSTQCVYWDTKTNEWSSKGCKILRSNRYETVCECSHLTSFAVLMDVHRYVGKELGLELLTLILCPASEVALALSIVILSSVNGLQRIRSMITTNLSICLLVGNALVLFVLDRNYFYMGEGLCIGAAMITHYVFMCAFMWMLIEGIQLYRMVVHVFDSGRSYIKHFGLVAYGTPLIIIAATATTGYLRGDKPYGGDVYCWLEGPYIWSFMGPVALIIVVNMTILFIALKTAYQLQQTKKLSPTFLMGRIKSCKTWFKGCFSLTVILGLTWAVGFFSLMKGTGGIVFAYIFTVLNASQGIFIFLFNCVFNDKVRAFAQRNLSTYLPSWITSSSISSNAEDNNPRDGSVYGKRRLSPEKNSVDKVKKRGSQTRYITDNMNLPDEVFTIPSVKIANNKHNPVAQRNRGSLKVDFAEAKNEFIASGKPVPQRSESVGTISSLESIPASSASDNGHVSSDTSHSALISKIRAKNN